MLIFGKCVAERKRRILLVLELSLEVDPTELSGFTCVASRWRLRLMLLPVGGWLL